MRPLIVLLLCSILGWPTLASQGNSTKPLTNADVMDMLSADVSPDIVIAKIKKSTCEFDTSPATLKALKAANTPDAVILAMIEASGEPHPDSSLKGSDTAIPGRVVCDHLEPVPVFSGPWQLSTSVEIFKVKCGDRVTIVEPIKNGGAVKIRTADGRSGYMAWARLAMQADTGPETQPQTQNVNVSPDEKQIAKKKHDEMQKASDDLEDCRTAAQNEYDTKMNMVNTMTITPVQRVYASTRLKQNYDAEVRACRARYEVRVSAIEAE